MVDFNEVLRRLPSREDVAARLPSRDEVLGRIPSRDDVLDAVDRMSWAKEAATPFVAGDSVAGALSVVADVAATGMAASVCYLPERNAPGMVRLVAFQAIEAMGDADLAEGNDLCLDPVGLGLGTSAANTLRADVAALAAAAAEVGMSVTLDGVPHDLVAETVELRAALAPEFPDIGMTVSANLLRSETDCLDLAAAGARVRLLRRGTQEPAGVAHTRGHDVDKAYVRCLRRLTEGARTIVATHDPTLLEIAAALADRADSEPGLGYQFRLGMVGEQAHELAAAGAPVSVLVPFGPDWAGYVARHVTLRPSAVGAALRAAWPAGGGQ